LCVTSGLFALVGGTVIGFASINTRGNAIAGLIVVINRPFGVGDRLYYKGQFIDVEGMEISYYQDANAVGRVRLYSQSGITQDRNWKLWS